MKKQTKITITGQISGNFELLAAIGQGEGKVNLPFNSGFEITFKTKKEAIAAIRTAYNNMKAEHGAGFGGVRVNADRTSLYYDASQAHLNNN